MRAERVKRRKGIYKFVVKEDIHYRNTSIKAAFENDWLKMETTGDITVKGSNGNGYAWDGCSPKINILDITLLGTPDGRINVNTGKPVTYYASLLHDVLYQFGKEIGLDRKVVDRLFLYYLGDFELRYVYHAAVRLLGGSFF